jgi:hypothetical protein
MLAHGHIRDLSRFRAASARTVSIAQSTTLQRARLRNRHALADGRRRRTTSEVNHTAEAGKNSTGAAGML